MKGLEVAVTGTTPLDFGNGTVSALTARLKARATEQLRRMRLDMGDSSARIVSHSATGMAMSKKVHRKRQAM
jgi:hypothetical protein